MRFLLELRGDLARRGAEVAGDGDGDVFLPDRSDR